MQSKWMCECGVCSIRGYIQHFSCSAFRMPGTARNELVVMMVSPGRVCKTHANWMVDTLSELESLLIIKSPRSFVLDVTYVAM